MSLEKAELKKLICHEIGVRLDDVLEATSKSQTLNEGGKLALRQASKSVQGLATIADQELDKGAIKDLETLTVVKTYITRAVNALDNLARHFENLELSAGGGVATAQRMVGVVKKIHDEESAKAAALSSSLSQTDVSTRRPLGTRPSKSIAERRKAEDKAGAKKKKVEDATDSGPG